MAVALYNPQGVNPYFDPGLPLAMSGACGDAADGEYYAQNAWFDEPLIPNSFPDVFATTGELFLLDPEIELQAMKFGLAIRFFYKSGESANEEFGRARSATVHGHVLSSTSAAIATIIRGDFRQMLFNKVGSAGGITTYTATSGNGAVSTLSYNGTAFTEYLNNGMQLTYQAQVAGGNPVTHQLTQVTDPSGVVQTYTYGSGAEAGLLKTIQVPGGRAVSFVYIASVGTSLLNAIQDWSGRAWTFQYDSNRNLTTLTTPPGLHKQLWLYGDRQWQSHPDLHYPGSPRLRHHVYVQQRGAGRFHCGRQRRLEMGL